MDAFSIGYAAVAVMVFVLTAALERVLIPILRSHKIGQVIYDLGPRWHKHKEGIPTMGGIGFILPILAVMAVWFTVRGARGEAAAYVL